MCNRFNADRLVRDTLSGDETAFKELIEKYQNAVYALAYNRLGNYHDAQDVAQEVFIKAYQDLRSLRVPQRFAGWLYVITANCCKMWLRKHRKQLELTDYCDETDKSLFWAKSADAHAAESSRRWIQDSIDTLPEEEASLLRLFYMSGLSYREIGEFLGISSEKVKGRLYKARQHLKAELEGVACTSYTEKRLIGGFTESVMKAIQSTSISTPPVPKLPITNFIPIGITATVAIIGLFFAVYGRRLAVDWSSPSADGTVVGVWLAEGNSPQPQPKRTIEIPRRAGMATATQEEIETFSTKGVVLREDEPAEGITIYAYHEERVVGQTLTDNEGTFHFSSLPKHNFIDYYLIASVPGEWIGWQHLEVLSDLQEAKIPLLRTQSRRWTVLDGVNYQPIKGARIKTILIQTKHYRPLNSISLDSYREGELKLFEAYSDEMGTFVLSNFPAGDIDTTLSVRAEGYAMLRTDSHSARLRTTTGTDLAILLEPEAVLEGRVVYVDTDRPAVGVEVGYGIELRRYPDDVRQIAVTTTDSDGRFKISELPSGHVRLYFPSPPDGWAARMIRVPLKKLAIDHIEGWDRKNLVSIHDFRSGFRRAFKHQGVILSDGATVRPHSSSHGSLEITDDQNHQLYIVTQNYNFDPEKWYLEVWAYSRRIAKHVEIQLVRCGTIRGRLTHAITHEPIADVSFRLKDDSHWRARIAQTDSEGVFQFDVLPGQVQLQAPKYVQPYGTTSLKVKAGQVIDDLVFEYDDGMATVEGRVVSMGGRPIANAIISERIAGLNMKRATTNEKGEFSVTLLRGERITLVAETEGRLRGEVTSLAGEEKSVEIRVGN